MAALTDSSRIIVIGASSGGIEALSELFRRLSPELNAAVLIVVHISADAKSYLPTILNRAGTLPVSHARDGEKLEAGRAYVAPPNEHLLLQDGSTRLVFGPKENGFRPAVDPLFQSAAQWYGSRVIGVILSGNLYDGTKGLRAVKRAGGVAIVQDPEEAMFPGMPSSALQYAAVDHGLPVAQIARLLNSLSNQPVLEKGESLMAKSIPDLSADETEYIRNDIESYETGPDANQRSMLTCPDCGGILWELKDGELVRYRCHVGHIYSPENLLASQDSELEDAFWRAIRVLVEKAALCNRLALRAKNNGNRLMEDRYLQEARRAERDADVIRGTFFRGLAEASKEMSAGEAANKETTKATK